MNKETNLPAFSRQLGNLRITVWRNSGRNGRLFHTTTMVRRFVDSEGAWKDAGNLTGLSDVVLARAALQLAADFINSEEAHAANVDDEQ